jgi:ankyrin repeat protein
LVSVCARTRFVGVRVSLKKARLLLFISLSIFAGSSCARLNGGRQTAGDCIPVKEVNDLRLIIAADAGNVEKMAALIKSGADVNASSEVFGNSAVAAVFSGNVEAVRLLLDNGANVNSTDPAGCSALIIATLNDKVDVAQFLVSRHADVNASCYPLARGKRLGLFTALKVAKAKNNEALVKALTEAGAKE